VLKRWRNTDADCAHFSVEFCVLDCWPGQWGCLRKSSDAVLLHKLEVASISSGRDAGCACRDSGAGYATGWIASYRILGSAAGSVAGRVKTGSEIRFQVSDAGLLTDL